MPNSPYTGLNPFSIKDAPFFFGRDHERDLIVANLMASRLTVLYGPSGVGKSSVLNAGALNSLWQTYGRLAPDGRRQVIATAFHKWQANPAAELARALTGSLGAPADGTLTDKLAAWSTNRGGRLLLMLDQFEEYLLYHERADDEFGEALPQVLSRSTLAVNLLISIREDSLARLDVFKGKVPSLFQNYLRLDRLTRAAAHAAVVGPLERFNQLGLAGDSPVAIEPSLVDVVLADVRTGRFTIGETGRGRVEHGSAPRDERIETPYLQLVMKRLWEEERSRNSDILRLDTYRRLGGAQRIVESHLDDTVRALSRREQTAAAAIFDHLVTPTKTKIAHTSADLANYAHVDERQISGLLEKLSGPDRILATVAPASDQSLETRYQIFHDVLASAVLAWTTRYRARRDQRRRIAQIAGVIAILAIIVALGVLVQRIRRQANLIAALQQNSQDIANVKKLEADLRDLATGNQAIASQVAALEQDAQKAKATQLTAALAEVRKSLGDVAAKNKTIAEQATNVGTSLEKNQQEIAKSQGISEAVEKPSPNVTPIDWPSARTVAENPSARTVAENGVKATLQQYAAAYNSLQVSEVLNVFPSFSRVKDLERSFNAMRTQHQTFAITGPVQLSDDLQSATVTCSVSGTFEPKAGNPTPLKPYTKIFYLRRRDAGWIITKTDP
jgi:uncharacterized protein YoxC